MFKIFCDFDNTITVKDTTDDILSNFASKKWLQLEKQYEDNLLTSKECLEKQIALLNIDIKNLENYIKNNIKVSEGFLSFVNICKKLGYDLTILSDGLDFVINIVLKVYKINDIKYFSNKLIVDRNNFKLIFPFNNNKCKAKIGCCKCSIVNKYRHNSKVIYIGDGTSDYCVSTNNIDLLFAKEKLANFCKKYNVLYYEYNNFLDINKKLNFNNS